MKDAMYIILHTGCLWFDMCKKSSAGRFFRPALLSIIDCFVYFLPAALLAHAAALSFVRPLSGFPARSSAPQANPAFPIWSCGTLHRSFSFVPEALHTDSRVLLHSIARIGKCSGRIVHQ